MAAGTLSSLQMESIIYASVKHEQRLRGGQRAGFFLGDGPGVGKGRQLEMFALGLKATGSYLCRSLSYSGAEFELENCALSDEMSAMYDRSCAFWQMLHNVFNTAASGRCSEGRKVEKSSSVKWAQFWGSHQRFFRQMLLSAKVPHLAELALEHVHTRNMAVVIGLQSTGESNIGQAMEQMAANGEDIDDFVSAPAVILRNGEFIFIFVRTGN